MFQKGTSAYGIGLWKHKENAYHSIPYTYWINMVKNPKRAWTIFLHCPGLDQMLNEMIKRNSQWGDVMRSCHQIENNIYQVIPYKSMVRNWGNDGSGLHCNNDGGILSNQEILTCKKFEIIDKKIKNNIPWQKDFFALLPKSVLSRVFIISKLFFHLIIKTLKSFFL